MILLYPKLPCICYRGIIKFHCIFAWFWRFMPQILYMIQGNNWGKITNLKFEPHENQKFPHVQSDWTKWDKYMLNGITRQILRYVPACSVRLNRYIVQCKALPSQQQCWNSTRLIHRLSLGPNKKSSKILVELAKNSPPSLGEEPAPAKVSFVFSD